MINTWNESHLHEALKTYYCSDTGRHEIPLEGSICDAILENGTILEIQTSGLSKLRNKLVKLLVNHSVILVYPLPVTTIIETYTPEHILKSRRKSPKHEDIYSIFRELTQIYDLLEQANFTLRVVFTEILDIRVSNGEKYRGRNRVHKKDKELLTILESREFHSKEDIGNLLPGRTPPQFTVKDLARFGLGRNAGYMVWVLRKLGLLEICGKKGRAFLYQKTISEKNKENLNR